MTSKPLYNPMSSLQRALRAEPVTPQQTTAYIRAILRSRYLIASDVLCALASHDPTHIQQTQRAVEKIVDVGQTLFWSSAVRGIPPVITLLNKMVSNEFLVWNAMLKATSAMIVLQNSKQNHDSFSLAFSELLTAISAFDVQYNKIVQDAAQTLELLLVFRNDKTPITAEELRKAAANEMRLLPFGYGTNMSLNANAIAGYTTHEDYDLVRANFSVLVNEGRKSAKRVHDAQTRIHGSAQTGQHLLEK